MTTSALSRMAIRHHHSPNPGSLLAFRADLKAETRQNSHPSLNIAMSQRRRLWSSERCKVYLTLPNPGQFHPSSSWSRWA